MGIGNTRGGFVFICYKGAQEYAEAYGSKKIELQWRVDQGGDFSFFCLMSGKGREGWSAGAFVASICNE
jgi:hypothetical protein